jgi:hypothetical protein
MAFAQRALGLCSRYSMKVRWPQKTKAAVSERSATRRWPRWRPPWCRAAALRAGTPMRKKPAAPRRDHQVGIRGAVVEEAAWALTQARASSRLEDRAHDVSAPGR